MVGNYHSFYSLEKTNGYHGGMSKVFGVHTSVYKSMHFNYTMSGGSVSIILTLSGHSLKDGLPYLLRKVDVTLRVNVEFAMKVFERWKNIQCASIISFR